MIKMAFLNIMRHKSRTFLALLGIAIGIASMISLIAAVDGIQSDVTNAVNQIQGITVMEKGSITPFFSKINENRAKELEKINGINTVVKEIFFVPKFINGKKNPIGPNRTILLGFDLINWNKVKKGIFAAKIIKGQDLKPGDSGVALIGESAAEELNLFVGSKLKVDNENYKVKGIFQMKSDFLEKTIVISLGDAKTIASISSDSVNLLHLDLVNPDKASQIADQINFRYKNELRAASSSQFSAQIEELLGSFRILLFVIAAIAAIVAGIGIVNVMLMSVLERFKEIGTLKAVGWTNYNVIKMILMESILIGLIGSIIGIALAYIASFLIGDYLGLTFLITPSLLIEAIAFSITVSLIASIWPTWKAIKINVMQALRHT